MNVNTVTDWTAGLITGLTAGMARFFGAIPNILGAIVLLIIGWVIAGIIGGLVTRVARICKVDTVSDRIGVNGFLRETGTKYTASDVIGEVVKWVIRLVFVEMAAEQLGMPQVSQIINQILGFIPNIVVAVVHFRCRGVPRSTTEQYCSRREHPKRRLGNAGLLARLTYGAVMAFAIIAALNELNVAPVVVDTLYIGPGCRRRARTWSCIRAWRTRHRPQSSPNNGWDKHSARWRACKALPQPHLHRSYRPRRYFRAKGFKRMTMQPEQRTYAIVSAAFSEISVAEAAMTELRLAGFERR